MPHQLSKLKKKNIDVDSHLTFNERLLYLVIILCDKDRYGKKKKYQVAYILERNLKLERIVANKMTNKYMIQYEDVINTKEVK